MSSTLGLGVQLFRNLAVSLMASKHNLSVGYAHPERMEQLGISLYRGAYVYDRTYELNEFNYVALYHRDHIQHNLNANHAYFHTKEIIHIIYRHLHTPTVRSNIIAANPFRDRYLANHDLFIHIRLTDIVHSEPVKRYYRRKIDEIGFDRLYLSSDPPAHPMIDELLRTHSNARCIDLNDVEMVQFASTCRYVVLSHGATSAAIGYLAFFSDIFYPALNFDTMWHGEMFGIEGWKRCTLESDDIVAADHD
jgi:hypothetical protein